MVTDGEIPAPDEGILSKLQHARENLGLEVHGLIVGDSDSKEMQTLCSHLHYFRSWDVVGGRRFKL